MATKQKEKQEIAKNEILDMGEEEREINHESAVDSQEHWLW